LAKLLNNNDKEVEKALNDSLGHLNVTINAETGSVSVRMKDGVKNGDLSKAENKFMKGANDEKHTGNLNILINASSQVSVGSHDYKGHNTLDLPDARQQADATKSSLGNVIAHEMYESYLTSDGYNPRQAHAVAADLYGGLRFPKDGEMKWNQIGKTDAFRLDWGYLAPGKFSETEMGVQGHWESRPETQQSLGMQDITGFNLTKVVCDACK